MKVADAVILNGRCILMRRGRMSRLVLGPAHDIHRVGVVIVVFHLSLQSQSFIGWRLVQALTMMMTMLLIRVQHVGSFSGRVVHLEFAQTYVLYQIF